MKTKIIYLIISVSVLCIFTYSFQNSKKSIQHTPQKTLKDNINLYDENGLKTGLWLEYNGLKEVYYKKGKKNGIFRSYSKKTGRLDGFGECLDNQRVGTWYYFHESGHLRFIEMDISFNYEKTKTDYGEDITPKFRSYVIFYYPNGEKKEEGTVLYDEDIEIDFFKSGDWKYYDNTGKLINK